MLFGLYIAKKLGQSKAQTFTKTVVRLASLAVSISIAVVILSYGILLGFKKEIREKVSGYAGHATIKNYDLSLGNESSYLTIRPSLIDTIKQIEQVTAVYPFINKAGILKSDSILEGLIFRGLPSNYDFSFYKKHLNRGSIPIYSDSADSYDIMISAFTADLLQADTGDLLQLYFIEENNVKRRRPKVVGIFNTGLQEFDKQFAIVDLRVLQRVVSTDYEVANGYEVRISDYNALDKSVEELNDAIGYHLNAVSVKEQYFTIFQWLSIVDSNVLIIIILMFIVAIINIITVLLILMIERIPMIGLFKSMGARNYKIMSIFSWQGIMILSVGLILGNGLAGLLAFLQVNYKIIGLSPDTYYMDAVPFYLPLPYWVIINLATIVLAYLFTLLPSIIVSRVSPSRSIQFK